MTRIQLFPRLLLLSALAFASSQVGRAQSSRTLLDNGDVKVLSVDVKAHEKTRLHEHKVNRVMIYLQPGRQDFEFQDGHKTSLTWKAGEPKWSPAAGMHIAEITSPNPITIVEIELKKAGAGKTATGEGDPVQLDKKHYKVEFENDQVRVVRVHLGPHEATPEHTHRLNRVVTHLTDQDFVVTTNGKADAMKHAKGEINWSGPGTHTEKNNSDKPWEAIMTELKY